MQSKFWLKADTINGGKYLARFVGWSYADEAGEYGAVFNDIRRARSAVADFNDDAGGEAFELVEVYSDGSVQAVRS